MAHMENGDPATGSTDIHGLTDDLLELILLRIGSLFYLLRAAATCKPWRRVVSSAGFLHRHRSLHGPLGHYDATSHGRRIVFVDPSSPSSSPPPRLLSRRLRLSGLVPASVLRWLNLTDCRGGLHAAVSITYDGVAGGAVVCDPWTGQYRRAGLLWLGSEISESIGGYCRRRHCLGAFVVDAGGGNGGAGAHLPHPVPDMSRFRVMCAHLLQNHNTGRVTALACVFSARDSRWLRPIVSTDLGVFDWDVTAMDIHRSFLGRAGGSLFWSSPKGGVVFAVDEGTGKFSALTLPPAPAGVGGGTNEYNRGNLRVIGGDGGAAGGGGTVRMVRLAGGDELEVLAVARQAGGLKCVVERRADMMALLSNIDGGGADWQSSSSSSWRFVDTGAAGHGGAPAAVMSPDKKHVWLLSVDAQTQAVKLEQAGKELARQLVSDRRLFPYELPWAPTISRSCM